MLRGLKRSFMSDEQGENIEYFGGYGGEEFIVRKNNEEMNVLSMEKNLKKMKKMRLNLDQDASRDSMYQNSSSEPSPVTPSSYSSYTDTTDNFFAINHQKQQQQKSQQYSTQLPAYKQYPLRISTRSDTSSLSDAEPLNPYANINSVLYLANLTRNSHILNETQEDHGEMDLDERENDFGGRVIENSITNLNENSGVIMSVIHTSINNIEDINKHDNSGNHNNEPDFGSVSGYQSINAVLREAFLRRHGL